MRADQYKAAAEQEQAIILVAQGRINSLKVDVITKYARLRIGERVTMHTSAGGHACNAEVKGVHVDFTAWGFLFVYNGKKVNKDGQLSHIETYLHDSVKFSDISEVA